jgi:hypothetical protein
MTKQEHESQRALVALSLLLCPVESRHDGKAHESKDHDPHDVRH